MDDVAKLEARLSAALDRISVGFEARGQQVAALEAQVAELETALARQAEDMARIDGDLQGLRATNDALREVNAKLRAANAEGLGDAQLIEDGAAAELDALKAARSADRLEIEAVLGALEPIIKEAS